MPVVTCSGLLHAGVVCIRRAAAIERESEALVTFVQRFARQEAGPVGR